MRTWNIILKSLREHRRSFWILLLTVSMGPFFIMLYYLIIEASDPKYDILVVNRDKGTMQLGFAVNHADIMLDMYQGVVTDTMEMPLTITKSPDRETAISMMKSGKADAVLILPPDFSRKISNMDSGAAPPQVEFIGDLTNTYYLVSAIWAGALLEQYVSGVSGRSPPMQVKETSLGSSGSLSDFEIAVPGLLIISIIMLMFTASIAFITEVEQRTILRLRLSSLRTIEYLGGIGLVQVFIGLISMVLTLLTAIAFGYEYQGSIWLILLVTAFCSISIVAFSLIVAAATRSANEVLIVGNFPLFLFMFFTGAAFPINSNPMFSILDYPVSAAGLMSPTHAITALRKILVMEAGISDIIPELIAIMVLTIIYFIAGGLWFRRRHLRST